MKVVFWCGWVVAPLSLLGQGAVVLPGVTIHSTRIANQTPVATFAMPVSALRFEPQVDIQARNLGEGQADVTLRGGIFENTGFRVGASTLMDPQTGHYFAEIPVAPAMLGVPEIVTGAGLAVSAANATVGVLEYGWRPVGTSGHGRFGLGGHRLIRGELYQGVAMDAGMGGRRLGVDVSLAHSASDGPIAHADHRFDRANVRLQLRSAESQTDVFAGYQAKFFGWPNLYTPFNSNETEDLETVLFALNHRTNFAVGDFFEAGIHHRRNKDDYAYNRFAPVGPIHPFQHTTWISGAAIGGRLHRDELAVAVQAEMLADKLESTSLTFGRYRTRTITKVVVVPEKTWARETGRAILRAGASFDDSNRDEGSVSPVVEFAREYPTGGLRRLHASYTVTSQIPTYTALNANPAAGLFRGNPNLGRQQSRNYEVGIRGQLADWTLLANVFQRTDEALVDWTFRRGVTARTANEVDVDTTGFELLAHRSWPVWDLAVGYTVLTKDHDYRGAPVDASFYALNYARHRLTAAVTVRLGRGFELRLDNAVRLQASNALRSAGGDEAIHSAFGLAYRPPSLERWEFSLQVDNVWNSDFQEVPGVPAAPRQVSTGVAYGW